MIRIIAYIADAVFVTRPMLWIPVWGFFILGYFYAVKGESNSITALWHTPLAAAFGRMLVFSCSVGAVYVLNQLVDLKVDKKNDGFALLAHGGISTRLATGAAAVCASIAIFIPLVDLPILSLLSLLALAIGIVYCSKPFSFSGRPVADFLSNAAGYSLVAFGAGWVCAPERPSLMSTEFARAALPFFLLMSGGSISSTLPDYEGDRTEGKTTTAVALGTRRAHLLATALICAGGLAGWYCDNWYALMSALLCFPLYVAHVLLERKETMEATYKLGGVIVMLIAGIAAPVFALAALFVLLCTRLYFKLRHEVDYPTLVPRRIATDE
ncbi:MAG: hypothetical protein GF398_16235 [Chitinivibrionales bacterium]|nr:hypothetical protein [Chitinivibrionales bacterium]